MVSVAATVLFAYLVLVAPARGKRSYARFQRALATDPTARYRFYYRSTRRKTIITAIVVALYLLDGRRSIGMPVRVPNGSQLAVLLWVLFCLAVGTVIIARRLESPAFRAKVARAARGWTALMPTTPRERQGFIGFAIGAGVTEEIMYRGFVFVYLLRVFPDAGRGTVIVATACAFGAVHWYQGMKGVFVTGLVGAWLGSLAVSAGLLAAIVVHAAFDLRILSFPRDLGAALERASGDYDGVKGTTS